jgi:hypothetical protein
MKPSSIAGLVIGAAIFLFLHEPVRSYDAPQCDGSVVSAIVPSIEWHLREYQFEIIEYQDASHHLSDALGLDDLEGMPADLRQSLGLPSESLPLGMRNCVALTDIADGNGEQVTFHYAIQWENRLTGTIRYSPPVSSNAI